MMMSPSPNNSTSNLRCGSGSRFMRICGICDGIDEGINATGRTFNDEPITISRSHSSLSLAIASWKASGRPSPKNTMSGFMIPCETRSERYFYMNIVLFFINNKSILFSVFFSPLKFSSEFASANDGSAFALHLWQTGIL